MNSDVVLLRGGLDMVTPPMAVAPGMALVSSNYEPGEGGYRRMGGYERLDGRPKPSLATYQILHFDTGSVAITAGQTLAGDPSLATAVALANAVVTAGTYVGGDAVGYVAVGAVTGLWAGGDDVEVGASPVAEFVSLETGLAPTDEEHAAYTAAEVARRRQSITAVTGSGAVRGVWIYAGSIWAFRDNAGGTAGVMFKATASGWTAQSFGERVAFTAGATEFIEGETLTQGGVTALIRRVVVQTGIWDGTATGYIVISGRAGGNYAAGAATSATGAGTLSGAQTAITLPPGGFYRCTNHNFYGPASSRRMYFVNGVGHAHEWDGTVLTPIIVPGLPTTYPTHVGELSNHLFLGYAGGGVMFSDIGEPLEYTSTGGSGQLSFGDDITEFIEHAQTSLVIGGKGRIGYVTGTDADTFQFPIITDAAGMKEHSAAQVFQPVYIDARGVRDLSATDTFGNWRAGSVSQMVAPLFEAMNRAGTQPAAAIQVKTRDQYRVFFDDGSGLFVYFGRKTPEIMPFSVPFTITCACSGEISGDEVLLAGDDEGYVFELDAGTSFDGSDIDAAVRIHFNDVKRPQVNKRFHSADTGVAAREPVTIGVGASFDGESGAYPEKVEQSVAVAGGGAFWNQASWDEFYWSAPINGRVQVRLDGGGQSCSLVYVSSSAIDPGHVLTDVMVPWTQRAFRRIGV